VIVNSKQIEKLINTKVEQVEFDDIYSKMSAMVKTIRYS